MKLFTRTLKKQAQSNSTRRQQQGRQTGGGGVVGVEHLSIPPDFEKIFIMGSWLPLN